MSFSGNNNPNDWYSGRTDNHSCIPDSKSPDVSGSYSEPPEHSGTNTAPPIPAEPDISSSDHPPQGSAGFSETHAYSSPYWTEAEARQKKHSTAKYILIGVCIVALLLIGVILRTIFVRLNHYTDADTPAINAGGIPGYGGETDPYNGDYNSFFQDYFSGEVAGNNSISPAPTGTGVVLELAGLPDTPLTFQQIYENCADAVVGITAAVDGEERYWGTGIVFTADGYVVTNYHVLDGTDAVTVSTSDGSEYDARLVGYDTPSDLAVLKIEADGLQYAVFGSSDSLQVGDDVVAIGNPLGNEFRGTMTNGIVSAINRDIEYGGHTMTLIQTNAAINEGNSGGPLINMYGQVIGITNMKMMSSYSSIEGIGFAIPSVTIKSVVDELIAEGYVEGRPALGITVGSVPSSAVSYYDLPSGLYVSGVDENSGAYEAGIQVGDIITAANGTAVESTSELNIIKDGLRVGDSITLTVYRNGKSIEIAVTLKDSSLLNR